MRGLLMSVLAMGMISACAAEPDTQAPDTVSEPVKAVNDSALTGSWDVSLFFSADSPPSTTEMIISAVYDDGTIDGSFYQSPFVTGRYTQRDGVWIITAVTQDNSGEYLTSGRLYLDGRFDGQTLSRGRGFLMPWTASRSN